ncbi:MAG: EAL domain-containing protein (putative c-di-GMP-specific phosphodiesterase class I) [Gammaproteobacteria bacterium]
MQIDTALILDLGKSIRNLTTVQTTIDMARNLNLKLVGEVVNFVLSEVKLKESGSDVS